MTVRQSDSSGAKSAGELKVPETYLMVDGRLGCTASEGDNFVTSCCKRFGECGSYEAAAAKDQDRFAH